MRRLLPASFALGLSLVLAPAVASPPAIGRPAPPFQLEQNGSSARVDLSRLHGHVVMLSFWASWCVPCRAEMPLLDRLYRKQRHRGLMLLGIALDPQSADAKVFLQKTPVSFPVLFDPDSHVSGLYGVLGMPSAALIDRQGRLRWAHSGYQPGDENEYLRQIEQLLNETGNSVSLGDIGPVKSAQ